MRFCLALLLVFPVTLRSGSALETRRKFRTRRSHLSELSQLESVVNRLLARLDALEESNIVLKDELMTVKQENKMLKLQFNHTGISVEIQTCPRLKVAFHAWLYNVTSYFAGNTVVPGEVTTNEGQGYDPSTGRFTAPISGTYLFLVTCGINAMGPVNADLQIMLNDRQVAFATSRDRDHPDTTAGHVILSVIMGDRVWLRSDGASSYYGNMWTTFSGTLL